MVKEDWKVGDEFIVIEDCDGEWLKKGDKRMVYTVLSDDYVSFTRGYSIRKSRIQKINSQKTYELW